MSYEAKLGVLRTLLNAMDVVRFGRMAFFGVLRTRELHAAALALNRCIVGLDALRDNLRHERLVLVRIGVVLSLDICNFRCVVLLQRRFRHFANLAFLRLLAGTFRLVRRGRLGRLQVTMMPLLVHAKPDGVQKRLMALIAIARQVERAILRALLDAVPEVLLRRKCQSAVLVAREVLMTAGTLDVRPKVLDATGHLGDERRVVRLEVARVARRVVVMLLIVIALVRFVVSVMSVAEAVQLGHEAQLEKFLRHADDALLSAL